MEYKSMSEAVRGLLEKYPPSKVNHADTVSRRLREFRYGNGWEVICVDPRKARYKKVEFKLKGKGGNHAT
jgi:hypothetical protein